MSKILRLPLNAELPLTCMTCGDKATHRVGRTFRCDGKSHSMKVPACLLCASTLVAYPRFQRRCGFLMIALLVASAVLFCLDWYGLATLSLLGMVPAGLHFLYYHWRFERDCLGIGKRFILLRVHADRFVQARDAAQGYEEYADWYERLRCEGHSRAEIGRFMEDLGYCTRDAFYWVTLSERRRRSFLRLHGLRRFLIGSTWSLVGLVGMWFFPPMFGVFFQALEPTFGGLLQMVTGNGYTV